MSFQNLFSSKLLLCSWRMIITSRKYYPGLKLKLKFGLYLKPCGHVIKFSDNQKIRCWQVLMMSKCWEVMMTFWSRLMNIMHKIQENNAKIENNWNYPVKAVLTNCYLSGTNFAPIAAEWLFWSWTLVCSCVIIIFDIFSQV